MALTHDQIEQLNALNEERMALHQMRSTPGWKLVKEHAQKTSAYAYGLMATADNPTVMAKQVGAWHVAESIASFPEIRLKQIEVQISHFEMLRRG